MDRLRSVRRPSVSRFRLAVGLALALAALAVASGSAAASAQSGPGHAAKPVAAAAWQRYVVAPRSRDVRPASVLSAAGDVTNPGGLLGHGVTTLTATPPPAWPAGASATASSYHAPNGGDNGQPRSYAPGNAIDGDTDTFWNDATPATYPAWLQITTTAPVSLPGITVLSNSDGVPVDYTVATWNGAGWVTQATVTGNSAVERGSMYEGAYTSAAHGWSTGVVPELTNELLGATPTGPGFSTWSVQPHPASVTWAQGQLPTPRGPLDVSWRQGHDQFSLRVTAPRGTLGDVAVPVAGAGAEVIVDGRIAWDDGSGRAFGAALADGYVTLHGVRGGSPVSVLVRE